MNPEKIKEVFDQFRYLRNELKEFVFNNPFNSERQYVIELLKEKVPYLRNVDEDALKHLYYKSRYCVYDYGQMPFDLG